MSQDNLIYGINTVNQLLSAKPQQILELFIANKDASRVAKILQLAKEHKVSVQHIDNKKLDAWLTGVNHQGVAAKIRPTTPLQEADLPELVAGANGKALFLVLDGVQDPHNLGACLRTADAAGVTAVIVPKDNAASITPTVRKVASGAADLVPFVVVSNLARALQRLQELAVWIVGLDSNADKFYYDFDLQGNIAIVLGAEGTGMRQLTAKHCDFIGKLAMLGHVESLNVSVTAGICLYEALRQRA